MRTSVFFASIAFAAAVAAPAFAQSPSTEPSPNPQMRQQFRAMHQQLDDIHAQARAQMLDALTPAHRQLLATIAGELATSSTPDYRGAAARLDAALSSSEKQAILSASQSARDKMRSAMQSARERMSQNGGPPMGPDERMGPPGGPLHTRHTPSAGEILLRTAMGGVGMDMHIRGSMRP